MDRTSILYVDDNLTNLQLFEEYLSDNFEIITESSPHRAFELIEKHRVKVVVSDQRMPEETGLNFLYRVHQQYPDVIKILCTAYFDHDAAVQALNQGGIFRYILKPYTYEQMLQTLESAVREYSLQQENRRLLNELQEKNIELTKTLKLLIEQEQKLKSIYQQSRDGIILIQNNTVVEINEAAQQIFNKYIEDNNNYQQISNLLQKRINDEKNFDQLFEMQITDNKGNEKYIEFNINHIHIKNEPAILVMVRDITERKENEKQVLEAIIATQENLQRCYAAELHDGIGPLLSTVKMYIEWLNNNATNKEQIAQQAIATIDESIKQVKSIANRLSPHILQRFGLIHTIKTYIEELRASNTIDVIFEYDNERFLPEIELNLYRILMECFSNSLKHSKCTQINLYIKQHNDSIKINYSDNGIGFDMNEIASSSKGMGLINIENRCVLMGAKYNLYSEKNNGFKLEIFLKREKIYS